MTDAVRLVGYARLSKSNENGYGLDVQRTSIQGYCARHGHELVRIETDDGASGASTRKRPGLAAALDACRRGDADGVIAAKLDRISRSLLDWASLTEEAQRDGFAVIAVGEAFDLSTPSGRAMAGMLGVFAQWERETISERTRKALAQARKDGTRLGRPQGIPSHFRTPAHVEARIRTMRDEGMSLRAIASALSAEGVPTSRGKTWTGETVRGIVKRSES